MSQTESPRVQGGIRFQNLKKNNFITRAHFRLLMDEVRVKLYLFKRLHHKFLLSTRPEVRIKCLFTQADAKTQILTTNITSDLVIGRATVVT